MTVYNPPQNFTLTLPLMFLNLKANNDDHITAWALLVE
jgi:hypothetical protein